MPHLYKYLIFPRQQLWGLLNSCRENKARLKKNKTHSKELEEESYSKDVTYQNTKRVKDGRKASLDVPKGGGDKQNVF